jgi:hypothetical protein
MSHRQQEQQHCSTIEGTEKIHMPNLAIPHVQNGFHFSPAQPRRAKTRRSTARPQQANR